MFIEKETKKINKKSVYYPFYESLKDIFYDNSFSYISIYNIYLLIIK